MIGNKKPRVGAAELGKTEISPPLLLRSLDGETGLAEAAQ
jgi:hypothetical protein